MAITEKRIFVRRDADCTLFLLLTYSGSLRNLIMGFRSRPCLMVSIRVIMLKNKAHTPISFAVGNTFFARMIYPITPKAIRENRLSRVKKTERIQNEYPDLSFKKDRFAVKIGQNSGISKVREKAVC
jgi:hypothetical protein